MNLSNNWMTWCYNDDLEQKTRQSSQDVFGIKMQSYNGPVLDLRTECVNAARSIRDTYPNEKFCLLFSGGSESEILVRSFLAAGVPFETFIYKYEHDINAYDVHHALNACASMGIDYHLIDFKLKSFFENQAHEYSKQAQTIIPSLLVQLPMCEMVHGIPIMGGGELILQRTHSDYSTKGTWVLEEWEYNWAWQKYFYLKNRPAIVDWCRWNPAQFLSWMNLQWFNDLVSDKYMNKLGIDSTKIHGYREAWPELSIRHKSTGMENLDSYMQDLFQELLEFNNYEYYGCERYVNYDQDNHPYSRGGNNYSVFYTPEQFKHLIRN